MSALRIAGIVFLNFVMSGVPCLSGQAAPDTDRTRVEEGEDLVDGLDGGTYEAYHPSVIRQVQQALQEQKLYDGPANGQRDEATMKAIGEFQQLHYVTRSGVPSPLTRELLLSGSASEPTAKTKRVEKWK